MKTPAKMLCIVMSIALLPAAYAQLYGSTELITEPALKEEIGGLEQFSVSLALAFLESADDLAGEAEYYYNMSDADITIVYDLKNNRIAIAKPIDRPDAISDGTLSSILENRKNEKLLIVDSSDANAYLCNIISDIRQSFIAQEVNYGTCSIIKDGICNESCYRDLDCECGNSICDFHENYKTCAKDCSPSPDFGCVIVSDRYCDNNCPLRDIDCAFQGISERSFEAAKRKQTTAKVLQVAIGSAVFLLITILLYMLEKNRGFRKRT